MPKKKTALTIEERLQQALVPAEEQPYEVPENWVWVYGKNIFMPMESRKPDGEDFYYIDIDAIDNKNQVVTEAKKIKTAQAPSRASRKLHTGDTVFSLVRPYLKNIAYIDVQLSDCIASTGFFVCTPNAALNDKYLYRLMVSSYVVDGLNKHMKGDNSPSIRKDDIENYPFPLPPLSEQQRIVERIEELFAKLDEAKERLQEVADSFAVRKAAILHKAFTGELIGKKIEQLVPLESLVDLIKIGPFGSALHESDYIENGIPLVNPKHIVQQHIVPQSKISISEEKAEELSSYRLKANDIVLGRRGEMGRCAPISNREENWICGTGSMIIRLKKEYDAKLYSLILGSQATVTYLENSAVGSTLKNLNEKIVRKIPVPQFSNEEQHEIVRLIDALLARERSAQQAVEQALASIDLMKKSILARAFRGELGTNKASALKLLQQVLAEN